MTNTIVSGLAPPVIISDGASYEYVNTVRIDRATIVDIVLTVQELQNDKAKLAVWLTSADEEERAIAELVAKRANDR